MADPELNKAEDAMKAKYLPLIRKLSHVELKKINKSDYKKKVIRDMAKMLPNYQPTSFDGHAQCVSNALQHEVEILLKNKTRNHAVSEVTESPELSDTILEDLNSSMHLDTSETATQIPVTGDNGTCDAAVSDDDGDDDDDSVHDQHHGDTSCLDDSITLLKQTVNSEISNDIHGVQPHTTSTRVYAKENESKNKCSDGCKMNAKSKRKLDMIRCSVCMTWYHEECVGIAKNEPVGLWLCIGCRQIPTAIQNEIKITRDEVHELKNTTQQILRVVNSLAVKLQDSIGGINDRLTAISKQMKTNDTQISESIKRVATATDQVKTVFEQKSCQILNKTATILDNVKNENDDTASNNHQPRKQPARINNQASNDQNEDQQNLKKNTTQSGKQPQSNKSKPTHTSNLPTQGHTKSNPRNQQEERIVDLTDEDSSNGFTEVKKTRSIKQTTLIVGSSLLKNVKVSDLNRSTAVRTFSGAKIDTIKTKLSEYNLDSCKTVILQVGGNDADSGADLETFSDEYEQLIHSLKENDHRVIVSGLLPRETVDLSPYNEKLRQLCDTCETEFIDNYDSFLLASGELPESYYLKDKLHLNNYGTKKLLSNIDKVHRVTSQVQPTGRNKPSYMYRTPAQHGVRRSGNNDRPGHLRRQTNKYCHICMKNGHVTQECWFNGRTEGWSGRSMR